MRKKPAVYPFVRLLCLGALKLVFPYEIQNGNSLPEDKAMIVCGNHISNIDPVFVNATQNRLLYFMAKKELFKNKLFAKFITTFGAFPVSRGNDGGRAIGAAEELLNDDNCVGIFIEGTRSRSGELGRPHTGVIVIAHATNTPILPCCITGRKGNFVRPFTKTKITYGTPITCEELGVKEGNPAEYRAAATKLMGIIAELRNKHREEFDGK